MTERLHFHFPLSCIGEGNGNPLQCSCLENPGDWGASWAAIYGVAQSRTWLKRLSSSSSSREQRSICFKSVFPFPLPPSSHLVPSFHLPLSPSLPPSLSFPFTLFLPALPAGDVISRGSGFLNISWMSDRFRLEVYFWKISQCCLEDCVGTMSCNPWMLSVQAACRIYLLILL